MDTRTRAHDFGWHFWSHLILILAIWTSPFWLSWKWQLVAVVAYYVQLLVWGDCILTIGQFRTRNREYSFYQHYLEKAGVRVNGKKLIFFLDFILPWLLVGAGVIVQRLVGWVPLVG